MKNMMSVQEVCELNQVNALQIRAWIRNGRYQGEWIKGKKRDTYRVYRYWFYRHVLFWSDKEIEQYHASNRGAYWLNYHTKKEPKTFVERVRLCK